MKQSTPPSAVHLHIDCLRIEGLPLAGGDGTRLREAIQAQLESQLGQPAMAARLAGLATKPRLTGSIHIDGAGNPAALGRKIAQSVCTSLFAQAQPHSRSRT